MADDKKTEEQIRANERFRISLMVADTAIQSSSWDSTGAVFELLKKMSAEIMISGPTYSAGFELLPDSVKAEFERRQEAIERDALEKFSQAQLDAIAEFRHPAPLYDDRDLTEPGAFVQLSLFPDGEDDGSGNDNGGGYLN